MLQKGQERCLRHLLHRNEGDHGGGVYDSDLQESGQNDGEIAMAVMEKHVSKLGKGQGSVARGGHFSKDYGRSCDAFIDEQFGVDAGQNRLSLVYVFL